MPRARRSCSHPRCPQLQPCPTHARKPWAHAEASSRQARGYGSAHEAMRRQVLAEEPTCRYCQAAPSTMADHIVPKAEAGTDERSNYAGCCEPCHRQKSAREGARARHATAAP